MAPLRFAAFGSSLLLAAAVHAGGIAPKSLAPGTDAPAISIKKWLKGKPIKALPKKGLYVVEFWATWCGPCVQTIPHVTKMAKANPTVGFLGVGIWEPWDAKKLPQFVKQMGSKMDYRVAYSGDQDGMAATWMKPAGQDGIPTAFLIKDGKIMWIGHPMDLEKPLAQVKSGKYDLKAARKQFDAEQAKAQREMAAGKAIESAAALYAVGRKSEAQSALDAALKKYPDQAPNVERMRFLWLANDDPKAWEEMARGMAASKEPEKLEQLNAFALRAAGDPQKKALAVTAIELTLEATAWKDAETLAFATMVYQQAGQDAQELKATNALLASWPKKGWESYESMRTELKKRKTELEAKLASQKA